MIVFSDVITLYSSSRPSNCIFSFIFVTILIKIQKNDPCKNMGKNIKNYATTQVHSPGEGREALRQIIQIFQLLM